MSSQLTNEATIRQAEQADLLEVIRIERTSFPQPWPFSAFEEHLGTPGFLVAERDGEVAGYVVAGMVPNYGRDIGHIKDFAVRPEARGQGIGTRLLRQALAALAIEGATDVKLEVREGNESAIRLYQRFGFAPARRAQRYYADGEDALIMVLDVEEWVRNGSDNAD